MKVLIDNHECQPIERALRTLESNKVPGGTFGFRYPFMSPGGYGDCWWEIDTSAAAEGYSWHDFDFAKKVMANFIAVQKEDGRIPLYGHDILPVSEHHPKQIDNASALPVAVPVIFSMARRSRDGDFQSQAFDLMSRCIDWWMNERYDERTGLVTSLFEETFPPYLGRPREYCGVDTNVIVADGMLKAAELASHLGRPEDAARYDRLGRELFDAVQRRMWDDENCIFRPLVLADGSWGPKTAEGFFMFLDRDMPEGRLEKMLSALKGEDFGWGVVPISSMARSDSAFTVTRSDSYQYNASWSGMVWTLVNRYVAEGLAQRGRLDEAAHIARRTVALLDGGVREFYAPDDGRGFGAQSYSWSAAHAIELFVEVLCGIRFDAWTDSLTVDPIVRSKVDIYDLALGDGVVSGHLSV